MQMNEFKSTHDFSSSSVGCFSEPRDANNIATRSTWSSQGMHLFYFLYLVSLIPRSSVFAAMLFTWSPRTRTETVSEIIMNQTLLGYHHFTSCQLGFYFVFPSLFNGCCRVHYS